MVDVTRCRTLLFSSIILVMSALCLVSQGWAQDCDESNRNGDSHFFAGSSSQYWEYFTAVRTSSGAVQMWETVGLQPQLAPTAGVNTPVAPALESFDNRLVLVVRGGNRIVYANTLFRESNTWTGWGSFPTPLFRYSPDLAVVNNTLVVSAVGTDNNLWITRSPALVNGFIQWLSIGSIGGFQNNAVACLSLNELRIGATSFDGRCYSRRSLNGVNWIPWEQKFPCP